MRDKSDAQSSGRALKGLRVIDGAILFAGSIVSRTLGDFGAGFIRVGHPIGEDGHGLWWTMTRRDKRRAVLDLKVPEVAS